MKKFAKKFLVALIVLLSCFQTTTVWADTYEEIPIKQEPGSGGSGGAPKCRARSRYTVQDPKCFYCDGEVIIEANNTVSFITVEVYRAEDNMTWINAGVGNTITLTVSSDPGTYYLYFTLSNGMSYCGKYILY